MKTLENAIPAILETVKLGDQASIDSAAKALLESQVNFTAGQDVTVIDDPTYSMAGVKAKYKGPSAKGSGFADIELPDGNVLAVQSDLLV